MRACLHLSHICNTAKREQTATVGLLIVFVIGSILCCRKVVASINQNRTFKGDIFYVVDSIMCFGYYDDNEKNETANEPNGFIFDSVDPRVALQIIVFATG